MELIHKTKPIVAIYMLAFLMLCCIASLATFVLRQDKLAPDETGFLPFLSGKVIASFEKKYEENLIIRDHMIGVWGAVQYGLFKSGGKKVVVGSNDWLFTTEEFDHQTEGQKAEARLLHLVESVNNHLKAHNIQLVVALVPSKARIYPEYLAGHHVSASRLAVYERFHDAVTAMGIQAPDLAQLYLEHKNDGVPLYLRLDTHWTPEGAELAAKQIATEVPEGFLEKVTFTTDKKSDEKIEGDLEKYIKTGPFSFWLAPEQDKIERRATEKSGETSDAGLFGDEVIPVALVGTSYSAIDKWNFEGALKEALGADVLNLADEGQGPLQPMAKFMKETDFCGDANQTGHLGNSRALCSRII